ncbi:MAG TPA: ABC transporter ATP-binding protein [Dongiaceae bacterium]
MIEISHLTYDYPGRRALDDVSVTIAPLTITALVGPNGAGKSTFLRLCAALDRPYFGQVKIDGLDVHDDPRAAHRRMGFLPDFFGLYDDLTVHQCLLYRARAQGVAAAEAEAAALRAADRLDLGDRLKDKAGTLSRGLRQRLAIAQAIIHAPKVLMLDEPASGLDPEARIALAAVLRRLRDDGMTIIVSSHILAELEDYSTHMLIIREGRIVEFTPIGHAMQAQGHIRLRIHLAHDDARLGTILQQIPGVTVTAVDAAKAIIEMTDELGVRAAVLKRLVAADLAVSEFAPERLGLQDAYLNHVHSAASVVPLASTTPSEGSVQ